MKKSIIAAGAASVSLAALPMAGVFAADVTSQTDTIDVILATTCTMNSVTHAPGTASGATAWGPEATANTLTANAIAGAAYSDIRSTEFNIVCNNKNGWNVSTVAGALTGKTTATETIPLGTVAENTTFWSYTPSTTDTDHITLGAANTSPVATSKLADGENSHATGNAGRTFKVTYGVSTANDISAQTYEGQIAYTLNQAN